jgi:tetraacyldisaccharide 4'-kinase
VALAHRVKLPVVILDDGFQHWRIRRDVNVLAVDTQDPWGGGDVIPRGRLREPFSAIRRADVVVLTRTEPKRQYSALLKEIRRHHPRVPILFARSVAVRWHPTELPPGPYAAFCGLANPGSFRQTLAELGLHAEHFLTFPDHHRYHPEDLRGILEGVTAILTTEKDWEKVKDFGLPIFWLETTVELDRGVQLLDLVKAVISIR